MTRPVDAQHPDQLGLDLDPGGPGEFVQAWYRLLAEGEPDRAWRRMTTGLQRKFAHDFAAQNGQEPTAGTLDHLAALDPSWPGVDGMLAFVLDVFRRSVGQWFPHIACRSEPISPDLELVELYAWPAERFGVPASACYEHVVQAVDGRWRLASWLSDTLPPDPCECCG